MGNASKKILTHFSLKGKKLKFRNEELITNFSKNNKTRPLSTKEFNDLINLCVKFYKKNKPIIIVGYNYTGAIAWIYKNFPKEFLKCVKVDFLFYGTFNKFLKRKITVPWSEFNSTNINKILVQANGSINRQNKKKLKKYLTNRTLVILSGGDGHPADPFYQPLIEIVQQALEENTPVLGSCMGNEILAYIHNWLGKSRIKVTGGFLEFGPQTEILTEEAGNFLYLNELEKEINIMHGNEYHLQIMNTRGNKFPNGKIIFREKLTNLPSGIVWDFYYQNQALSLQGHPEIEMLGGNGELSEVYKQVYKEDFLGSLDYFQKKYKINDQDIQNMLIEKRLNKHIGFRFIGRALLFLLHQKISLELGRGNLRMV